MIEAMILRMHAEYQKTKEADIGMYILSRMTIGLAVRIGMHQDGLHFHGMTPFQWEVGGRQWAHLRMVDVIWSFTSGIPVMIKDSDTDTKLPSNLRDEDFNEATLILPPERPVTELTDISFLIMKTEIARAFARIIVAVTGAGRHDTI